jgi:hypothetical protein
MKSVIGILWLLLGLGAFISLMLFVSQGGFGTGQGRFDMVLMLLSSPWCHVNWPEPFYSHDFIWIVAIPWVINGFLLFILTMIIGRIYRGTGEKSESEAAAIPHFKESRRVK